MAFEVQSGPADRFTIATPCCVWGEAFAVSRVRQCQRLAATSKAIRWVWTFLLSEAMSHTVHVVNTVLSTSRTVLFDKPSWESSRLSCSVFCTCLDHSYGFVCTTIIVMDLRLLRVCAWVLLKPLPFVIAEFAVRCGRTLPLLSLYARPSLDFVYKIDLTYKVHACKAVNLTVQWI